MTSADAFDGRTVLVVGGAGFVGGNLVRMILAAAPQSRLIVVDNLLSSERETLPSDDRVTFREGSIADDEVLRLLGGDIDYAFHLATFHGNQNSIARPLADHDNNTITTLKLYERLKSFPQLRKVVYASAGCSVAKKTFGEAAATTEDAPLELRQDSPYSISKIVGEFYSIYYYHQFALPVVRARFQNVYGPGEVLGAGLWRGTYATVWRNVTPTFIYRALKAKPLPLENEGIATRDFIFVEDVCRGLIACALRGKAGDVYNIGSGYETSIKDLASLINDLTGNPAGFQALPKRPWDHSGRRFASPAKAERELGFRAEVPLRDGILKTIGWTRNNLAFIEATIRKHRAAMEAIASPVF